MVTGGAGGCAARLCSVGAVSPCALISGDCRASGAEPAVLAPRPVQLLLSKTFLCVCSSWLGAGPAGQTRRGPETGARRGGEAWSWLCPASVVGGAAPVARPRTGGSHQVCGSAPHTRLKPDAWLYVVFLMPLIVGFKCRMKYYSTKHKRFQ